MQEKEPEFSKHTKILKNATIALALSWLLQTVSCQPWTEKKQATQDKNGIEIINKNTIVEPREYKIYKLDINLISTIKYDLLKAKKKTQSSDVLKKYLTMDDFSYGKILPKITKESSLDNNRTSRTGAVGYMQLTDRAVQEINRIYDFNGLVLDKNNAVDNIILWVLYRKLTEKNLKSSLEKNGLQFSQKDREALMIFSYNVWESRAMNYLKSAHQNWVKTMEWFIKWLVEKKCNMVYNPVQKIDPTYRTPYTDYFWWKKLPSNASWELKKLEEWIRYVSIILSLQKYLETDETIKIISIIHLKWKETLFSKVKEMRDTWIFKETASINQICEIILKTNWFDEKQTPQDVDLFLIKEELQQFQK